MICGKYPFFSLKLQRAANVAVGNSARHKVLCSPRIFSPWELKSYHTSPLTVCQYQFGLQQKRCQLRLGSVGGIILPTYELLDSQTNCRREIERSLTTQAVGHQNPILPDNILRSPVPDLDLATDVSLHKLVFDACDRFKDRLAVEEFLTGRKYTYSQMKEAIVRVSSALYRRGYRKGDILLAFSTNNIDYVVLMVACAATEELARQLHHCGARGIVTEPQLTGVVEEAVMGKYFLSNVKASGFEPFQNLLDDDGKSFPDVAIDPVKDVLFMPYSSGTTGFPKGVMLSHHNTVANLYQYGAMIPTQLEDRCIGLLPLFHAFGMTANLFPVLLHGASVTYLPKFEPQSFLSCIQDRKINFLHLVPPLILFLAKHPLVSDYDLTSLKRILVAAAPLGESLMTECREKHSNLERFIQGYGMTEASSALTIDSTQTLGSVGFAVPNTLIKIVDTESENVVDVEEPGEIRVKGPQVMLGYYNNQEATHNMISPEGWMSTGDIGYFDKNGLVFVQDRLKELIKYKGSQVAPAELEALLLSHPDIQDAAVVGVPDEAAGELPRAFVVLKPGAQISEQQVADFVEGKVAPSKKLRGGVQFLQEIPKSPSGKILRRVIKSKYL